MVLQQNEESIAVLNFARELCRSQYEFRDGAAQEAVALTLYVRAKRQVSEKGWLYSEIRATPRPTQAAPAQRRWLMCSRSRYRAASVSTTKLTAVAGTTQLKSARASSARRLANAIALQTTPTQIAPWRATRPIISSSTAGRRLETSPTSFIPRVTLTSPAAPARITTANNVKSSTASSPVNAYSESAVLSAKPSASAATAGAATLRAACVRATRQVPTTINAVPAHRRGEMSS